MRTQRLEKELEPKQNQPTTIIIDENGKRKEVDFLGALLNLDELTNE
jgi:hypothetical protein